MWRDDFFSDFFVTGRMGLQPEKKMLLHLAGSVQVSAGAMTGGVVNRLSENWALMRGGIEKTTANPEGKTGHPGAEPENKGGVVNTDALFY